MAFAKWKKLCRAAETKSRTENENSKSKYFIARVFSFDLFISFISSDNEMNFSTEKENGASQMQLTFNNERLEDILKLQNQIVIFHLAPNQIQRNEIETIPFDCVQRWNRKWKRFRYFVFVVSFVCFFVLFFLPKIRLIYALSVVFLVSEHRQ